MAAPRTLLRCLAPSVFASARRTLTVRVGKSPSLRKTRSAGIVFKRTATTVDNGSMAYQTNEQRADRLISEAADLMSGGDATAALKLYDQSLELHQSAAAHYNRGVALYALARVNDAIVAWESSLKLAPSADVHNNLATAVMLAKPPQPERALEHYRKALELDPSDPQIRFNLGAVLEATNQLQASLEQYKAAKEQGIDRADQNIRNVGAKLLRQKIDTEAQQKS